MPLMTSADGRQQRIVPDRSVDAYRDRGWTGATTADPPNVSDKKADWVAYAKTDRKSVV